MMTAEPPADTRMMGITHTAFRRDLAQVRLVLTATPAPQGGRRRAVADQLLSLMRALRASHPEDSGL
jgi:hypothetical protein